jgi:hypothetical protein
MKDDIYSWCFLIVKKYGHSGNAPFRSVTYKDYFL